MIDIFVVVVTDGQGATLMRAAGTYEPALFCAVPPELHSMVARAQASNTDALYTICKLVPVADSPAMH